MGTLDRVSRIVIVEDHRILREGLRAILSDFDEYMVVGEAGDGIEGIRCIRKHQPDLVLLDLSMPKMNGMEVISEIRKESPETKILILSIYDTANRCLAALQNGAHGYVQKDARRKELLEAINSVLQGRVYISPVVQAQIDMETPAEKKATGNPLDKLTKREREVLKLIAEGHTSKQIAELLYISPKTIDNHRTNLMRKLSKHSVQALTSFALQNGLLVED